MAECANLSSLKGFCCEPVGTLPAACTEIYDLAINSKNEHFSGFWLVIQTLLLTQSRHDIAMPAWDHQTCWIIVFIGDMISPVHSNISCTSQSTQVWLSSSSMSLAVTCRASDLPWHKHKALRRFQTMHCSNTTNCAYRPCQQPRNVQNTHKHHRQHRMHAH